jgi:cyanophycinase-like exopeptidase
VIGPLALHGGGEFLAGDEPFLRALLDLAAGVAAQRDGPGATIRIELLTTAVARHRPEAAFAVGSAAFQRVAATGAGAGAAPTAPIEIDVRHARVIDATSAADPEITERLANADLVYLPGGDPDAVVGILAGTAAWHAVEQARSRGAVVAGASAGAMALGELTWTRDGYVAGFGWAGRLVVVPHASADRMAPMRRAVDALPGGPELSILGLPERAGVIGGPGAWTVVGAAGASVWWFPPDATAPRVVPAGSLAPDRSGAPPR